MTTEAQPPVSEVDVFTPAQANLEDWISANSEKGFIPVSGEKVPEQPVGLDSAQTRENMIRDITYEVRNRFDYSQYMNDRLRVEKAARLAAELMHDRISPPVKRGPQ